LQFIASRHTLALTIIVYDVIVYGVWDIIERERERQRQRQRGREREREKQREEEREKQREEERERVYGVWVLAIYIPPYTSTRHIPPANGPPCIWRVLASLRVSLFL
jgi:hypothetical protein